MGNKKHQSGSGRLIILTIILAVGLFGALGYVFYQNFIQTKTDNSKKVDIAPEKIDSAVKYLKYSHNSSGLGEYSFEYPSTGWSVNADTYSASISTNIFEEGPMGAEKGSYISFGLFNTESYKNIAEQIAIYKAKRMITKLTNITVDGQPAFRYPCYEYCRYTTLFEKDNVGYEVILGSQDNTDVEVYDHFLDTLKIK